MGVEICILINGKACMKMRLKANGQADFANNTSHPDPGVLESLPLRPGKNHLEARILHSLYAFNSFLGAEGAIWWWPCEARVCVVDIDGTVTISDKRGTCYIVCAIWASWVQCKCTACPINLQSHCEILVLTKEYEMRCKL